jgi:hypothetical protein
MLLTQDHSAVARSYSLQQELEEGYENSSTLLLAVTTCSCQATPGYVSPTPCAPLLSSLWPDPR